jgi:hypothetical protein
MYRDIAYKWRLKTYNWSIAYFYGLKALIIIKLSQILHLQIHWKHFVERLAKILYLQVPFLEPVHLIDDFVDLTFLNYDIKVLESFFQA